MSHNYEEIAARFWNLPTKGAEEANREKLFMDDIIQKAHLDREIERYLEGVETVFDGGAGAGRFSIPLAKRGLRVTHFDISQSMLAKAREMAVAAGVADRMEFVEGRLTELSQYPDGAFDLVLSFDAPVSYTYPRHGEVLRELVRIARKAVVVSVASRFGSLPYLFNPVQKEQYLVEPGAADGALRWYPRPSAELLAGWQPAFGLVDQVLATGLYQDPEEVYRAMEQGQTPWPVVYAFTPEELQGTLEAAGLAQVRLGGPGALARSIPQPILHKLLFTPSYREQFLDRCYAFDSQPSVCGFGKDNLVASGVK